MDSFLEKINIPFSRFSLFVIYFWFGILKIIGSSPANPLVSGLLEKTLPFIAFDHFIIIFSIYEMIIGICFFLPKLNKIALILLVPHLIMIVMPLILLPEVAWQGFLTPTLEGQYMIKNLLIVVAAINIFLNRNKR